jgi:DNA-binding transcriptional ArsR family regulator
MEEMKYEIIPLDLSRATELAQLFKAFSDPSRLRILSVLVNAEKNVGEIAALTGLSESAASHQLRGLRQIHLVSARREGRQVFYALEDQHIATLYQMGLEHLEHEHD